MYLVNGMGGKFCNINSKGRINKKWQSYGDKLIQKALIIKNNYD